MVRLACIVLVIVLGCISCSGGGGGAGPAWEGVPPPVGQDAIYHDNLWRTDKAAYERHIKKQHPQVYRNAQRLAGETVDDDDDVDSDVVVDVNAGRSRRSAGTPHGGYGSDKVSDFRRFAATQENALWCWAACIQMSLRTAGIDVSQAEIVQANYGRIVNLPAFSIEQIASNLVIEPYDESVRVQPRVFYRRLSLSEVVDAINNDQPVIAAVGDGNPWSLPQHVVMVYGYQTDQVGVTFLRIYDPWPSFAQDRLEGANFAWRWEQSIVVEIEH